MAQWLAHWTSNSKVEGSSPFKVSSFAHRSHRPLNLKGVLYNDYLNDFQSKQLIEPK